MKFDKIIISSGATKEWIDPVRFISNASSGKMGFHLSEESIPYAENLVYIHGSTLEKYSSPKNSKIIKVETTEEMLNAILKELVENTLLIMAAAPADFKPKKTSEQKIKKEKEENFLIELEKNPDILLSVKNYIFEKKLDRVIRIGFAAETENLEQNAKSKLQKKGLKFIIGNYVSQKIGFGEVESSVKIFSESKLEKEINSSTKENIAKEIIQFLNHEL